MNSAESTVAATLKMSGGMIGTLNCSYTVARCPYSQRSLLYGTRGTLYQHMNEAGGGLYSGPYYVATDGGKPSHDWAMMSEGFELVSGRRGKPEGQDRSPFPGQLEVFAEGIRRGAALENSLRRNLNTLAVVEAIGKSLLSGAIETVERE